MPPISNKRQRSGEETRRPKKKIRVKQRKAEYHSSSEDEGSEDGVEIEVKRRPKSILKLGGRAQLGEEDSESEFEGLDGLDEAERNTALNAIGGAEDDDEEDFDDGEEGEEDNIAQSADDSDEEHDSDDDDSESQSETTSMTSSNAARLKKKRHDPTAFATSISKILSTKLSNPKRTEPILSRSKVASTTTRQLSDNKLEAAARAQLRSEKKAALQKGRVQDVLGLEDKDVDTGKVQEEERRLKKVAQRGVVKLFNAVRAAQVKGEEARRDAAGAGTVGMKQREERVSDLSKEGFLEMISRGARQKSATAV